MLYPSILCHAILKFLKETFGASCSLSITDNSEANPSDIGNRLGDDSGPVAKLPVQSLQLKWIQIVFSSILTSMLIVYSESFYFVVKRRGCDHTISKIDNIR